MAGIEETCPPADSCSGSVPDGNKRSTTANAVIKGLTQKVSFCFLGRVKFRKVMLEKLNPSHSCGAGPPVHKATGGHGFSNITLRTISIISK